MVEVVTRTVALMATTLWGYVGGGLQPDDWAPDPLKEVRSTSAPVRAARSEHQAGGALTGLLQNLAQLALGDHAGDLQVRRFIRCRGDRPPLGGQRSSTGLSPGGPQRRGVGDVARLPHGHHLDDTTASPRLAQGHCEEVTELGWAVHPHDDD